MHDNDFGRGKKKGDVGRLHDKLDLHIRIIENKEKKKRRRVLVGKPNFSREASVQDKQSPTLSILMRFRKHNSTPKHKHLPSYQTPI